jgi:peptide/nickel transport system permease protein
VTAVFLVMRFIPGDPVDIMLGESAMPAQKEVLRHNLGLDRPVLEQYFHFLSGLLKGEMGESIRSRAPVFREVFSRWPATLELTLSAMFVASLVGITLGAVSAARKNGFFDRFFLLVSLLGVAIPNFLLGPLFIIAFSIWLGWLPVSGRDEPLSIVLPTATLACGMAAHIFRLARSSMLEVVSEEFITSARARGVPEWKVFAKHALSNALLPIVTVMGLQLGALLSGAVITETIFAWPGVGRLLVEAIESRDYPLVQGCVLSVSLCYVAANILADFAYAVIDPRVRMEK